MEHVLDRIERKLDQLVDDIGELKIDAARALERHPSRAEFEALEAEHQRTRDMARRVSILASVAIGAAGVFAAPIAVWIVQQLIGGS